MSDQMSTQSANHNFRNPHSDIRTTTLKIGDYDVKAVPTGIFGLDGGAMFGTVPRVLWEKTNPPDEKNRIPMEARALLLISANRKVLIDCGVGGDFIEKYGEKLGPKFAEMYNIDRSQTSLDLSLKANGLSKDDITDVILTHLHFDHAGGATCFDGERLAPTFKNATYYVQRKNYETALNPNIRERASYFAANFEPLLKANCLRLLDGDIENLLPGISVRVSNGHTMGQQIVKISDEKSAIVYCADLIPTSSHVRSAWIMGYDLDPLTIIEEKQRLLQEAAAKNWLLFFEHDPYMDAAQVQNEKNDYSLTVRMRIV